MELDGSVLIEAGDSRAARRQRRLLSRRYFGAMDSRRGGLNTLDRYQNYRAGTLVAQPPQLNFINDTQSARVRHFFDTALRHRTTSPPHHRPPRRTTGCRAN